MRFLLITLFIFLGQWAAGQFTADFEDFDIGLDSALVDAGASGGFTSGDLFLANEYNAEFDFFSKWAISSRTDTLTAGSSNSSSAFAGGGKASETYAVAAAFSPVVANLGGESIGKVVTGVYLTNNTYAALSMREGDMFAKKFGGESGDDPDFFLLTIKGWSDGSLTSDSVDFYLADYTFDDNAQDYIVKGWSYVNLESLGGVDSLQFSLTSSDVGAFGMNTPAFFCIDRLAVETPSSALEQEELGDEINVFPNPSSDFIKVGKVGNRVQIFNTAGQQVYDEYVDEEGNISIVHLEAGVYYLVGKNGKNAKFVKN